MNLESLGRTLGELYDKYAQSLPESVYNGVVDVVNLVDRVDEGIEEFFGAFNAAAGIEADDYHCETCRLNDAPVEDLSTEDMIRYIADYHPNVGAQKWA